MDLQALSRYAIEKMTEHGLLEKGWRFQFDAARARFGVCRFEEKVISVSRHLARANGETECYDTVLHEIAHALAGRNAGHGPGWKALCRQIGARPVRCFTRGEVQTGPPNYWAICPKCNNRLPYFRRPRGARACGPCCRKHNGGRFDAQFQMVIYKAVRS